MNEALTWASLIGAAGSIAGVIAFWFARGKAEADALAAAAAAQTTAAAAQTLAHTAIAKVELVTAQLADTRVEFARDYASHKDLAAAENRSAENMNAIRTELHGMNNRLDRVIEGQRRPSND